MGLTIYSDHFSGDVSPEAARNLFKSSIVKVEVEPFTYCNRVCWFCPNSKIDRRSTNKYMAEELYLRILSDLASIDYKGAITWCRYNEPLADRIILTRIKQARDMLPEAFLYTHTNGDYLKLPYLGELRDAGLNQLKVQVYLGPNDRFSDTAMLTRMTQRLMDLGLRFEFTRVHAGDRYVAKVRYEGVEVTFEGWNYDKHANDRAQTVTVSQVPNRTSPCLIPFTEIYIDYDGSMTPCCNIRSDEPTHKPYIVGDLGGGRSIFDVYADRQLASWRKSLAPFGEKAKPCNTCGFATLPGTPEIKDNFARVLRGVGI